MVASGEFPSRTVAPLDEGREEGRDSGIPPGAIGHDGDVDWLRLFGPLVFAPIVFVYSSDGSINPLDVCVHVSTFWPRKFAIGALRPSGVLSI